MNETLIRQADEIEKGDSLHTSFGWCPVLDVHLMPKSVKIALLTPIGERAIKPQRADLLTVAAPELPDYQTRKLTATPVRLFEPQMEGQLALGDSDES